MSEPVVRDFGVVDGNGDYFEFHLGDDGQCPLRVVVQSERGPQRRELAVIPLGIWRKLSARAVSYTHLTLPTKRIV